LLSFLSVKIKTNEAYMQNPTISKLLEKRVEQICKKEELKRLIIEKISQTGQNTGSKRTQEKN